MQREMMFDYKALKRVISRFLPHASFLSRRQHSKLGVVNWGNLRRLTPVSNVFGFERGQPIDRYYIETFLFRNDADIKGNVMEIGDATYTRMFGGDKVIKSDVLHVTNDNPQATLVGDLITGDGIPSNRFDCMILTQTFPFIYDVKAAIANAHSALKPGGILLVTLSGISQISRYDMERWGDYWRFTNLSAKQLFGDVFGLSNIMVETHGNVLAACAFLQGLASCELKKSELDHIDPDYQVLITVRAVKSDKINE